MEAIELLKKIKKIEIKSKGLTNQIFAGEYHTAFKGRGMAFSEVREYQYGDNIKDIDWNVTARYNTPFVKVFEEEREMTVMLVLDMSRSNYTGSQQLKKDFVVELAAVIAFSAIANNDKVGAILFTDKMEKFIPPKKGKSHILRIISDLLQFEPTSKGTDIGGAMKYLNQVIRKRCNCFLISDFIDDSFEKSLLIANQKHDLIALQIEDPLEQLLPDLGWIKMLDPESGNKKWVNSSSKKVRQKHEAFWRKKKLEIKQTISKNGIDHVAITSGRDYVKPLIGLFKRRAK